jgi:hypothetical protein
MQETVSPKELNIGDKVFICRVWWEIIHIKLPAKVGRKPGTDFILQVKKDGKVFPMAIDKDAQITRISGSLIERSEPENEKTVNWLLNLKSLASDWNLAKINAARRKVKKS